MFSAPLLYFNYTHKMFMFFSVVQNKGQCGKMQMKKCVFHHAAGILFVF